MILFLFFATAARDYGQKYRLASAFWYRSSHMLVLLEHSGTGLDPLIGTRLWLLTARGIIRLHRPDQMFAITIQNCSTTYLPLHPNRNVHNLPGLGLSPMKKHKPVAGYISLEQPQQAWLNQLSSV